MSSHEHRFRTFSSVEYDGQLYMTPQNFIESVTMSEPRSTFHTLTNELLRLDSKFPGQNIVKLRALYPHETLRRKDNCCRLYTV